MSEGRAENASGPSKPATEDASADNDTTRGDSRNTNDDHEPGETSKMLDENTDDVDGEDSGDDISMLPIDQGWAWVILAGATLEVFVYGGMLKSYGIFFVEFQKRFGSSASETNVMQTIHNIVVSISGVFVSNVGMKYLSPRTSVYIGGIVSCLAYLISAFATDIRVMSLTIGVIAGVANVMLFLPLIATVGIYFKKHRGIANSIHVSGSSIGSLVFGPFYTAMFDYYGYTGTMMIVAALMLNSLISGSLIRPISFYEKHQRWKDRANKKKLGEMSLENGSTNEEGSNVGLRNSVELKEKNISMEHTNGVHPDKKTLLRSVSEHHTVVDKRNYINKTLHKGTKPRPIDRAISYDPEHAKAAAFPSPMLARRLISHSSRARTFSEVSQSSVMSSVLESIGRSKIALYTGADVTCETISVGQINALEETGSNFISSKIDNTVSDTEAERKTYREIIINFFKTVFDVSVFNLIFVHYLSMAAVAVSGSVMMSVYLIPYAKDVGATSSEVSIMFIVLSCVDLVSRLCSGFIADRKWLKPTTILAIATAIIGALCHVIRFFNEFWSLIVFAVLQGAFSGIYMCLYNVILIENLGLNKFKSALGFVVMCHGVSIALFFQLTALLRDVSGNYHYTYHLIGTIMFMSSVLSFTLPLTTAYVKQRSKKKTDV